MKIRVRNLQTCFKLQTLLKPDESYNDTIESNKDRSFDAKTVNYTHTKF